jgi:two-component system OmpR family sensor kinase
MGAIALTALVVADVATYRALESYLTTQIDQQLAQAAPFYLAHLESGEVLARCPGSSPFSGSQGDQPGNGTGAGPDGDGGGGPGQLPGLIQSPAVVVVTSGGSVVDGQSCPVYVHGHAYRPQVPSGTADRTSSAVGSSGTPATYVDAASTVSGGPTFRVFVASLGGGDVLLLAEPLSGTESTLHRLLLVELAVTAAAVVVALAGGFWLVRLGLKPLRDMEATAESIAEGNLTERVPGENPSTEVGRLARTLNVMLGRIEAAFAARVASEEQLRASEGRLRRFVADASHELRTPIAAVSAYAELFDRGASEHKEDLERLMGGIRTETGRMEHLVTDLLLLARLDEGRPMERRSVDLVALCAESVRTATAVGPAWPVTFSAGHPLEIVGDPTSLRQVVDNLLGNVRAHTPEGTTARVEVADAPDGGAVLTVADDGPGMAEGQAEHVFERFYRADPSRSRLHGGAGLGLSIVSAIVAAHGGTVSAASEPGTGTTFTVVLPAEPPRPVTGAGDSQEVHRSDAPASQAGAAG